VLHVFVLMFFGKERE